MFQRLVKHGILKIEDIEGKKWNANEIRKLVVFEEPKNSLVNQYTNYLKKYDIDLVFEQDALDAIVDIAATKTPTHYSQ